jgi:hypothetical protein
LSATYERHAVGLSALSMIKEATEEVLLADD